MSLIKSLSKINIFFLSFGLLLSCSCGNQPELMESIPENLNSKYVLLSSSLLSAVKSGNQSEIKEIQSTLKKVDEDTLANTLRSDAQKKAFWINVYNAHIQILLNENPSLFDNRGDFFGAPRVTIAGNKLSFDDIEHGIIRVHFALNCGAKSCPLVAVYDAENFDQKINQVAKDFLQKVSTYKPSDNEVITTPLFSWFRGDFNGKKGILKFLKKYEVVPEDKNPSIVYDNYDWTLSLGNYYESN